MGLLFALEMSLLSGVMSNGGVDSAIGFIGAFATLDFLTSNYFVIRYIAEGKANLISQVDFL